MKKRFCAALTMMLLSVKAVFADIAPLPVPEPVPAPAEDVPPTGDNFSVLIIAAAVAVIALVIAIRSIKSSKQK